MKARLPGHWSFILCDKKCVSSSSVENWCSKVLTLLFQVKQSFFVLFFAANSVMPNRWLQVTSDHLMNLAMLDTTMVCRNGPKKSLLGKSLVILFFVTRFSQRSGSFDISTQRSNEKQFFYQRINFTKFSLHAIQKLGHFKQEKDNFSRAFFINLFSVTKITFDSFMFRCTC